MPRVVILGAGFAGVQAAVELEGLVAAPGSRGLEVLLVGENNYFLFTPLLPQIASSYTNPRHIVQPVRDVRGRRRFRFRRDTVRSLDLAQRRVQLAGGALDYDFLVLALGSRTDYFNVRGAREHTRDFKSLQDAVELREAVIDLCEHADHTAEPAVRQRLLTFVVVGGGYTGVELIAELQDFLFGYVARHYRGIRREEIGLVLLEAMPEILRGLHADLVRHARRRLRAEGIAVRTGARVTCCFPGGVEINGSETLAAETVIWCAGVRAHELVESLPCEHDRRGRALVNGHLQLESFPEVFIVGDSAAPATAPEAPQVGPVAIAQGRVAGRNVAHLLRGEPLENYRYEQQGMLISLGMNHAVVSLAGLRFGGYFAWLLWNAVHLYKLVGLKKQVQVALDWSLATVFPRDSSIVRRPRRCRLCDAGLPRSDSGG